MKQSKLNKAMQDALYGDDPISVQLNKEKLKTALLDAVRLVDSGRLGAIIVVEVLDAEKDRVMAVPFGDQRVVLQACKMVMNESAHRAARDLAKDMDDLQGIAAPQYTPASTT